MKFNAIKIGLLGLLACCLVASGVASAQAPTGGATATAEAGGSGDSLASRVEQRSYVFEETGEKLPYAVFVSSKVEKDKKAPLIVALRGAGGDPNVFMHEPALKLAEEGGYILVGPMGYRPMGSYGMPSRGFGGFGGRGGRGMRGGAPGAAAPAPAPDATATPDKTSEYSEKDVMNVLAMVRKEFNVDPRRIYLMGHSQGGAGALFLGGKYADIWAAVAGLAAGAPGYQFDTNSRIKELPLLLMVGEKDGFIATVQGMDKTMNEAHIEHEYKEMPGLDHGGIIMGAMPDVFRFFGEHVKPEPAKAVGTPEAAEPKP